MLLTLLCHLKLLLLFLIWCWKEEEEEDVPISCFDRPRTHFCSFSLFHEISCNLQICTRKSRNFFSFIHLTGVCGCGWVNGRRFLASSLFVISVKFIDFKKLIFKTQHVLNGLTNFNQSIKKFKKFAFTDRIECHPELLSQSFFFSYQFLKCVCCASQLNFRFIYFYFSCSTGRLLLFKSLSLFFILLIFDQCVQQTDIRLLSWLFVLFSSSKKLTCAPSTTN